MFKYYYLSGNGNEVIIMGALMDAFKNLVKAKIGRDIHDTEWWLADGMKHLKKATDEYKAEKAGGKRMDRDQQKGDEPDFKHDEVVVINLFEQMAGQAAAEIHDMIAFLQELNTELNQLYARDESLKKKGLDPAVVKELEYRIKKVKQHIAEISRTERYEAQAYQHAA
jgi:hypothetical protein